MNLIERLFGDPKSEDPYVLLQHDAEAFSQRITAVVGREQHRSGLRYVTPITEDMQGITLNELRKEGRGGQSQYALDRMGRTIRAAQATSSRIKYAEAYDLNRYAGEFRIPIGQPDNTTGLVVDFDAAYLANLLRLSALQDLRIDVGEEQQRFLQFMMDIRPSMNQHLLTYINALRQR